MTTTMAAPAPSTQASFYCSTSGTSFSDKEAYLEHMRSDFHRYNLKRKVAGMPPVTKEWFEARKELLTSSSASASKPAAAQVWLDPLTRKKFMSESTYISYTRSKKYQDLVKKSGQPAPTVVMWTKAAEEDAQREEGTSTPSTSFNASAYKASKQPAGSVAASKIKEEDEDEDGSGWETASDADMDQPGAEPKQQQQAAEEEAEDAEIEADEAGDVVEWEEWDVCRCLFDNHVSASLDANLEYMFRKFGFYLPDAEFLQDPVGLMQYLGAKLHYGRVPLYSRGDSSTTKHFRSLHAVQRHMVDTCQCRMLYDDNEDEYAQYYDYGPEGEEEEGLALSATPASALALGGFELLVPGEQGQGGKVLGTREFARYYRQRHRLEDSRQSVQVNTVQARYRSLGIALTDGFKSIEARKATQKSAMDLRWEGKRESRRLVFSNFVKNLGKGVGREY